MGGGVSLYIRREIRRGLGDALIHEDEAAMAFVHLTQGKGFDKQSVCRIKQPLAESDRKLKWHAEPLPNHLTAIGLHHL